METSVFDLLGRSLVADEHKGDYAAAAAAARRLVSAAEETGAGLDHALVAKGLVELLAGTPGAALATFDRLRRLDPVHPALLPGYFLSALASATWGLGGVDVPGVVWHGNDSGPLWSYSEPALERSRLWEKTVRGRAAEPRRDPAPPPWVERLGAPAVPGLAGLLTVRLIWSGALDPAAVDGSWAMSLVAENLEPDDHSGWGFLLRVKAEHAMIRGDDVAARQSLGEATDRYRQGDDGAGVASCALLAGDWLLAPRSSPLTLGLLDQLRMSSAARWHSRPDSLNQAEQAYQLAEQGFADHPRGRAALALRRSYLAALRDDAGSAMSLAARAAEEFESCGDERGFRIASMHLTLHRLAAGVQVDTAGIAEELAGWALGPGSPSLAFHLGGLAGAWGRNLLHEQGDVRAALRCHELAGELYRALGTVVAQAQSRLAVGEAHSCAGDQHRAALSAEQAVLVLEPALHDGHPLLMLAAQLLPNVAHHALSLRYVQALDDEGLAAAVRRLRPLRDKLHALLVSHARVVEAGADRAERYPNEHRAARENLAIATKLEPILDYVLELSEWQVDWLRAARLQRDGFWSQARQELEALLARCRADSGKVAREQAPYALLALRRFREAAAAFDAVADGFGVLSLVELAPAVGTLVYDTAESRRFQAGMQRLPFLTAAHGFERAAEVVRELEALRGKDWWRYGPEPWSWLGQLGNVAQGTGRLTVAAEWYEQAIDALESRRFGASRDSWLASYYGGSMAALIYVAASRCALRRKRGEQALELSERGRARATADLLASGARDPLIEAWRAADARSTVRHNQLHQARIQKDHSGLSDLEHAAAMADRELAERERELADRSPLLLLPAARRREHGLAKRIVEALSPGTALVAYRLHDDGLLVWALTDAGLVVAEEVAVDTSVFVERVRLLRDACVRLDDDWREHAAHLGETLLTPVADVLCEHRRLLIVPSGPLHGLPFSALPWHGQPLVASHEISFLPAASLAAPVCVPRGGPVTAFGDPGTPSPLPWAREEAEQVGDTVHIGSAVTRETVLAALRRPGVVHIASHGTFDSVAPLNSGLWLADGHTLTVADLMGTRIRADLVVLTACGTGRGAATHGEDVMGLPRGLLVGGAAAVVAPLWNVYDIPTARLAVALHRRLRAGEPVTSALRAAQDAMREGEFGTRARHPGCWASLVAIENPTDTSTC
jgi:CHAT domain-containing protein